MKRGFTLIELLVVIAIISILAAILFPVFATAREKARQSACMSNMKQIGLAYTQYEQDYDEMVVVGKSASGWGLGWGGQLYSYVKSTQVFLCPSDPNSADVVSYAVNANLVGYSAAPATPLPVSIAKMTSPSKTVLLFEITGCTASPNSWSLTNDLGWSPAGNGIDATGGNSLNGANGSQSTKFILNYATGLFNNSCLRGTTGAACSRDATTIPAANSYFASVDGRHSGGAVYLMADNHAKFFLPTQVVAGKDTIINGVVAPPACPAANPYASNVDCALPQSFPATFAYH